MQCGRLEEAWPPSMSSLSWETSGKTCSRGGSEIDLVISVSSHFYSLSLFLSLLTCFYLAGLCGTVCVCAGCSSIVSTNGRGQRSIWSLQMLQHPWKGIGPVQCFMCWGGEPPVSTLLSEFGSFRLRWSLNFSVYLQIICSAKVRSSTPSTCKVNRRPFPSWWFARVSSGLT